MRNLHNIEKSAFKRGCYVGYSKSGGVYHIRKQGRGKRYWTADVIKWIAPGTGRVYFQADTLADMSKTLESA